jgi:HAE1 family hydrophobic/amphiphilic exporter-1
MANLTLIAAMVPIALGSGPGAGARASMAKVIIGGQDLFLLLTLLVTPVAYSLGDDFTNLWHRLQRWLRRASEPSKGSGRFDSPMRTNAQGRSMFQTTRPITGAVEPS